MANTPRTYADLAALLAAGIGSGGITGQELADWLDSVMGTDTPVDQIKGTSVWASGLTGAVSATRFVGGTANAAPVAGTFARGDFVITQTGKIYICTVLGSPGTWVLASGGGGTPAVVLGTAVAAGVATTFIRTDDTIAAFDATTPTTIALGDAATTGAVAKAARRDHGHGFPTLAAISPLTTKGDIWVYSTVNARLAVGADGLTAIADSSAATGLSYGMPTKNLAADWFFAGS